MIAIIDYKAGNLASVRLAFQELGVEAVITSDADKLLAASRVVFPGVGAAGSAMRNLRELGIRDIIPAVVERGTPFLGICLGMQILFEKTEEDGGAECLGIAAGSVKRFRPASRADKVPHMGWNAVEQTRPHFLFRDIADGTEFYFVHSYYAEPSRPELVLGRTEYAGVAFASVVGEANWIATQFHPEKSGRFGLQLLRNFCEWKP